MSAFQHWTESHFKGGKEAVELERRADRAKRVAYEKEQKAKVVARDGVHYCRLVPGCAEREKHETCHVVNKGAGGDHGERSSADQMIRGCFFHHQGRWSLHSGDLRVEYLTAEGTNGPIQVWGTDPQGQEYLVGREKAVCEWERD